MKHLFTSLLLICVAAGSVVDAAPVSVRIQTRDKKVHLGSLLQRTAGGVIFQPKGAASSVTVSDAQIAYVRFPIKDSDEERITRLFEGGEYSEVSAQLNEMLSPYMQYIALPSNLSHKFLRWMIASYWVGDVDRVSSLSEELTRFGTTEFINSCLFYGNLVQLEKGNADVMKAFLGSQAAATVYPENSPARFYIDALLLQKQEQYIPAIRKAAQMIAQFSRNADWMPKAELLCAELYYQMEMPESAESVLADINEFYSNPQIKEKAAALAVGK